LSVEVPSAEVFIFSRDYITKYILGINITTKTLKNKMIEVITKVSYKDPTENKRKSHFEISYATVVKIIDKELDKQELEKILLCDIQKTIYPEIERILIKIIKDAGFPELRLEKNINFL
jgi:preprotein translocase subunit SecB